MNKAVAFAAFVVGAAVGAVVAWQGTKKFYERQANDEIDEMAKYYKSKLEPIEKENDEDISEAEKHVEEVEEIVKRTKAAVKMNKEKPSVTEYAAILNKENYTNYSNTEKREDAKPVEPVDRPYVISSDEFGDFDNYNQICLTYFADKILADDNDEIVDDPDDIVGLSSLNELETFEDDVIHVRNDRLKCDYEIVKDLRTYASFIRDYPYKADL